MSFTILGCLVLILSVSAIVGWLLWLLWLREKGR